MALVKFNRTATKATAIGSSKDADTLYFPTDEQSIYLGGKRVGGDRVSHAAKADHATNADNATNASYATNADNATNADHAKNADNATNASHANTADSATTAGTATSAGTATTAGKVGKSLSLQLNGGSAKTFDGSASVTFNVTPSGIGAAPTNHNHDSTYSKLGHTHTPSEVGAAPTNHNHDSTYSKLGHTHTVSQITDAGAAAKKGVDNSIGDFSSANLPTSDAVRAYVTSQIKNYTSAFRYAGTLSYGTNKWIVNNIPFVISDTDFMDYGTFEGGSVDDSLLRVGFTVYVTSGGTFVNGETVERGDMVTCVGLYGENESWEPQYQIVNSNITVTETVDKSSKVPTAKAVNSAIDTAITAKINALDNTLSATSGKAITGITQENGVIKSITQAAFNNYTHPNHTATTGVPTANAAPGFGGTFQVNQISSDSQGHVTSNTSRTITIPNTTASTSNNGLMTTTQVTNLNSVLDALTWK